MPAQSDLQPRGYYGTLAPVKLSVANPSGALLLTPGSPFAPNPPSYGASAVGDFNNDGASDIVVAEQNIDANLTVLLGDGQGGFVSAPGSPFSAGFAPVALAVGDFNRDGKLDIAAADTTVPGTVTVLLGADLADSNQRREVPFKRETFRRLSPSPISTSMAFQTWL